MNTLRQEIKNTLDELMGECEGICVPEPESTKYVNELLKIFEKYYETRKKKEENQELEEFLGLFK